MNRLGRAAYGRTLYLSLAVNIIQFGIILAIAFAR